MESSGGCRVEGMEVPLLSTDSIEWVQVSIPSSSISPPSIPHNPLAKDSASCCVVGNPPSYFIWRTSKNQPNKLELLKLSSHKEISRIGLRLTFPDMIFPFAFICEDEGKFDSGNHFVLYALTLSGITYTIRLRNNFDYETYSPVSTDEILEYNTKMQFNDGDIRAVTAVAGYLVTGRSDGSVCCFRLGVHDPSATDFMFELRDDTGFGRLWSILSRGPLLSGVQDLVISKVHQRKLIFVLHSDGILRIWDLLTRVKIFSHAMTDSAATGTLVKLWVGEVNHKGLIFLALLHRQSLETCSETIFLHRLVCNAEEKMTLLLEPSLKKIRTGEAGIIDVSLSSNKLWVLKEDGLILYNLFSDDVKEGLAHYYLLETFIADLLFQSSDRSSEDLLCLAYSTFSSSKEEVASFISAVFLRRLLFPGIHYSAALRKTFEDYNNHFTDFEFGSFTADGLKKEIVSLVEHQGGYDNPLSNLHCWSAICSRYVNNWCAYNAPRGLLIDPSTGALGLIRDATISLFRDMEDAEHIIYGSFDEQKSHFSSGDELDWEILLEFLECIQNVSKQLGKSSSAVFYESLLSTPNVSSVDLVPRFLKILETGYSPSIAAIHVSEMGADTVWEKEISNHRNLRKFSAHIFLSLHSLRNKAETWGKVMDVVERYLKFLVPHKVILNLSSESVYSMNSHAIVQSTSQISKVMFESAFDVLMLLSYITSISGQVNMSIDDVSRVKLDLVPMIHEIVTEWHIIHFYGTTSSESTAIEDFSSRLSSLQIDSNTDKRLWSDRLGKCDFSLSFILLLNMQSSSENLKHLSSRLLNPSNLISSSQEFTSWLIWGKMGEETHVFFSNAIDLALILLRHGQYSATECLLNLVDGYVSKEKIFESLQAMDGKMSVLIHLLGCCLVAQTQHGLHGLIKERKSSDAVCCFFRAASVKGALKGLQSLPPEAGWLRVDFSTFPLASAWKLQYYQWVMQLFEQFNMNEAASQFALAALEQVDEALHSSSTQENSVESVTTVKGRLWANVFKLTLDLNNYHDAYCAIISNPDEESKNICLRRFIIVLFERGAIKILCDGQLPLIGFMEKVERELAWKAERSDLSSKPNPYQLLYAFEMHRHNWRRAASYIYLYSVRLKAETVAKDPQQWPLALKERLNGLSAAINALQLVHPAHAWIETPVEEIYLYQENYPNKKARMIMREQAHTDAILPLKNQSYLDVGKLENEFVLTSAEYRLSLSNIKWTSAGYGKPSSELIDLLVESNSYDMAFTVILKFCKGSALKRELERVFVALSLKCCPRRSFNTLHGKDKRGHGFLLTSALHDAVGDSPEATATEHQCMNGCHWITLELYLDKYKCFHPRLPLIVAGNLLSADPQIELPLWLARIFKSVRNETSFGMTGSESNPGSLFCLYVDYGRYTEATNLLMEYMQALATVRPADVMRRKRPFAVWFPYTSIERLWLLLEESIRLGHRIDQCQKLKKLLHGVLSTHLNLLKVDSDDIRSSTT